MNMGNPVIFKSLRDLNKQIITHKLSVTELVETFLQRLEFYGPSLNAVVSIARNHAIKYAEYIDQEIEEGIYRGPLQGIPFGVKDLLATKDTLTTWGAFPLRDQEFNYDATIITKLHQAGAILTSKLAMIELAGGMGYRQPHASFTGPPKNPWNQQMWTGGSSSGSGAAVSAGLIPFAIGSETWGSILSPANNCGITGLRPTYGRVSRFGAMALSWSLDKLGPLCLTADDCGLVLEVIAGYDSRDPTTYHQSFKYQSSIQRNFTIGIVNKTLDHVDEEVQENFNRSISTLEHVAEIKDIELPDYPYEAVTRTILNAESVSAFENLIESGQISQLTAPEDRYSIFSRTIILAKDYLRALRLRGLIAKSIDKILTTYDAIIAPTRPQPATPIIQEFRKSASTSSHDILGAIGNAAGLPAISVPNGFTEQGLPTGLQFIGRAYNENVIIALANAYQSRTSWHEHHPPSFP
jgi:aspartyl-tRNA(Asn)/glutamyl-tRNA(Gln) amidotransferase subunit A